MSKTELKELLATAEELERLPPEHPLRIIPIALRECDERLVEHVLVGDTSAKPLTWNRIIAIGNLEAATMAVWAMYPPPADAADSAELSRIKAALMKERVARCYVEALIPLKRTGIMTGAIALYGTDAEDKTVLVIGRHPDLTRPKAVCLLLAAILHAEAQATSAAN